jgi:hypothetical protein
MELNYIDMRREWSETIWSEITFVVLYDIDILLKYVRWTLFRTRLYTKFIKCTYNCIYPVIRWTNGPLDIQVKSSVVNDDNVDHVLPCRSRIVTDNKVQGTRNKEQGTRNKDKEQGARSKEQGTRSKEQGARNKEQGTRNKVQGARSKEQGTRNKEQGTRNKEQEARSKKQEARSKEQGATSKQQGARNKEQGT